MMSQIKSITTHCTIQTNMQPDGADLIISLYLCPKYHLYSVCGDNKMAKLNEHIKHCHCNFHAELMLDKISQPYYPGILKKPVVEYCIAYNLQRNHYHFFARFHFLKNRQQGLDFLE